MSVLAWVHDGNKLYPINERPACIFQGLKNDKADNKVQSRGEAIQGWLGQFSPSSLLDVISTGNGVVSCYSRAHIFSDEEIQHTGSHFQGKTVPTIPGSPHLWPVAR